MDTIYINKRNTPKWWQCEIAKMRFVTNVFWGYPSKIKTCPMTCVRQDAWIAVLSTAARSCGFQSVFTAKLQRRMMKWRWQPNMGYRKQMAGYLSSQSSIQGETHRSRFFHFFPGVPPSFGASKTFAPFVCQESSGMESETSQTKPWSNPLDLWIRGFAAIISYQPKHDVGRACDPVIIGSFLYLCIGINQWVLFPITSYISSKSEELWSLPTDSSQWSFFTGRKSGIGGDYPAPSFFKLWASNNLPNPPAATRPTNKDLKIWSHPNSIQDPIWVCNEGIPKLLPIFIENSGVPSRFNRLKRGFRVPGAASRGAQKRRILLALDPFGLDPGSQEFLPFCQKPRKQFGRKQR